MSKKRPLDFVINEGVLFHAVVPALGIDEWLPATVTQLPELRWRGRRHAWEESRVHIVFDDTPDAPFQTHWSNIKKR